MDFPPPVGESKNITMRAATRDPVGITPGLQFTRTPAGPNVAGYNKLPATLL